MNNILKGWTVTRNVGLRCIVRARWSESDANCVIDYLRIQKHPQNTFLRLLFGLRGYIMLVRRSEGDAEFCIGCTSLYENGLIFSRSGLFHWWLSLELSMDMSNPLVGCEKFFSCVSLVQRKFWSLTIRIIQISASRIRGVYGCRWLMWWKWLAFCGDVSTVPLFS